MTNVDMMWANARDNRTATQRRPCDGYIFPLSLLQASAAALGQEATIFYFRKESDREAFAVLFRAIGSVCHTMERETA